MDNSLQQKPFLLVVTVHYIFIMFNLHFPPNINPNKKHIGRSDKRMKLQLANELANNLLI